MSNTQRQNKLQGLTSIPRSQHLIVLILTLSKGPVRLIYFKENFKYHFTHEHLSMHL